MSIEEKLEKSVFEHIVYEKGGLNFGLVFSVKFILAIFNSCLFIQFSGIKLELYVLDTSLQSFLEPPQRKNI